MIKIPSDGDSSGRSFGKEEIELLREVINSGTLNCTKGTFVTKFEKAFAVRHGVEYCTAVSSGTAAIHSAVAALDPEPGDEVVTTPITDMGAISAILFQNAIPVFADVDPETYNVTAETIAPVMSRRTRAIIVTHLFGNPCNMEPIMKLAGERGVPVIEDAAQAFLATYNGALVGTIGDIGCFSLQQGKHITTGEGGLVITKDQSLARKIRLFHDKAWGYGDPSPDHYFLAPNYRMTELQGAVGLAQLSKLDGFVEVRRKMASRLIKSLDGLPGINAPRTTQKGVHSYWRFPVSVDEKTLGTDAPGFGAVLRKWNIPVVPRYIQKPAFECEVLKDRKTYGSSGCPYTCGHASESGTKTPVLDQYPGTYQALERIVVIPWNEKFREEHVDFIAEKIKEAVSGIKGGKP